METSGASPGRTTAQVKTSKNSGEFSGSMYMHAASIVYAAQRDVPPGARYLSHDFPTYKPTRNHSSVLQTELWVYELAFNTLKFQELLKEMLSDSRFHDSEDASDDLLALEMVMLFDLQDRNFQPRKTNEEETIQDIKQVEERLLRFRTKLAASLARIRIKKGLKCIDEILPQTVREKHQRKSRLPLCTWVNTLKASVEDVCENLKSKGFSCIDSQSHLEGRVFCRDLDCPDVLLFPQQAREHLDKTGLLKTHTLIIQEKSRCLAAHATCPLFSQDQDILVAGSVSLYTVAHVAVKLSVHSGTVFVCGVSDDPSYREDLLSTFSSIGCKNVCLLVEELSELHKEDLRIHKVRVILLLPRCSASALSDPIAHIINEDGDKELLLHGLTQCTVSADKLETLVRKQDQDLSRALSIPRVHGVVYCTCSVNEEENEQVVTRALKNVVIRSKLRPFRITSVGWSRDKVETFYCLEESHTTDGCFLCVLKREDSETVMDILAGAAAKGLLTGLTLYDRPQQDKKHGKSKRAPPTVPAPTDSLPNRQLSFTESADVAALTEPLNGAESQQVKGQKVKSSTVRETRKVKSKSKKGTTSTHKRRLHKNAN